MSAPHTGAPDGDPPEPSAPLGAEVGRRLRFPGPRSGRERRGAVGAVASSSVQFAAGTSRPVALRRALAAPGSARVRSLTARGAVAPPRWWAPDAVPGNGDTGPIRADDLPPRGLPRAVRRVPNEQTWTPGGIAESLVSSEVRVRRLAEVSAVGSMAPPPKLNAASARAAHQRAAHSAPPPPPPAPRRPQTSPTSATPSAAAASPSAGSSSAAGSPSAGSSSATPSTAAPSPTPTASPAAAPTPAGPSASTSPTAAQAPAETAPSATAGAGPSIGSPAAPSPSAASSAPASPSPAGPAMWRPAPPSSRFADAVHRTPAAAPGYRPAEGGTRPFAGHEIPPAAGSAVLAPGTAAATMTAARVPATARPALHPPTALASSRDATAGFSAFTARRSGVGPLRRMVGGPHAVRPSLRAVAAPTRPAAGFTRPEAAPTAEKAPSRAAPPATSPTATTPTSSAATRRSAAPPTTVGASAAPSAPAGSAPASGAASATVLPLRRRVDPAEDARPAPRHARPEPAAPAGMPSEPASEPAAEPEAGPAAAHAAAEPAAGPAADPSRSRRPEPAGVALSLTRMLPSRQEPAAELRPAIRVDQLAAGGPLRGFGRPDSLPSGTSSSWGRLRRMPASSGSPAAQQSRSRPAATTGPGPAAAPTTPIAPGAQRDGRPAASTHPSLGRPGAPSPSPAGPAARRLSGLAMPDQLAVGRRSVHGAGGGPLGSSFGAPEVIRPASVEAAPAAVARRTGLAETARHADGLLAGSPAAAASMPLRRSVRQPAPPPVPASARPGNGSPQDGAAGVVGPSARRAATGAPEFRAATARRLVGDLGGGAVLRQTYVMAPPPVSIRPAPHSGPPVPDVARRTQTPTSAPAGPSGAGASGADPTATGAQRAGRGAADPPALFTAAATLLRTMAPPDGSAPSTPDAERGQAMTQNLPELRRRDTAPMAANSEPLAADPFPSSGTATGRQLDEFVDLVVERIEQRVIDELERRGRRAYPGSF